MPPRRRHFRIHGCCGSWDCTLYLTVLHILYVQKIYPGIILIRFITHANKLLHALERVGYQETPPCPSTVSPMDVGHLALDHVWAVQLSRLRPFLSMSCHNIGTFLLPKTLLLNNGSISSCVSFSLFQSSISKSSNLSSVLEAMACSGTGRFGSGFICHDSMTLC